RSVEPPNGGQDFRGDRAPSGYHSPCRYHLGLQRFRTGREREPRGTAGGRRGICRVVQNSNLGGCRKESQSARRPLAILLGHWRGATACSEPSSSKPLWSS